MVEDVVDPNAAMVERICTALIDAYGHAEEDDERGGWSDGAELAADYLVEGGLVDGDLMAARSALDRVAWIVDEVDGLGLVGGPLPESITLDRAALAKLRDLLHSVGAL